MSNMTRGALVGMLALVALIVSAVHPAVAAPKNPHAIPGQYIIALKNDVADVDAATNELVAHNGLSVLHTYTSALKGFTATVPAGRLAALQANPNVAAIMEDEVVTIAAQNIPTGIRRIHGDVNSTRAGDGTGSVNVDVAVIDTGIDTTHVDLNVVGGKNCVRGGKSYTDGNGHGTHVAGTIGAKDDANGVVGVAPGARLWAVRVLDNTGAGTISSVICGIDWVTSQAGTIEVANMSLGGSGSDSTCGGSDAYHNAICTSVNAGVTYVVAAGNAATNANNYRPATYAEVITVSALADFNGAAGGGAVATCRDDVDDTFANFSNYGADVDLIAPGVCITSTWKGGSYNTISGTSMAAPHVAGAAALYKSKNAGATPMQVKTALQNTGTNDWNMSDDPDEIHERLLNVSGF